MKTLLLMGAASAALASTSVWAQIKTKQAAGFSGTVAASVKEATDHSIGGAERTLRR